MGDDGAGVVSVCGVALVTSRAIVEDKPSLGTDPGARLGPAFWYHAFSSSARPPTPPRTPPPHAPAGSRRTRRAPGARGRSTETAAQIGRTATHDGSRASAAKGSGAPPRSPHARR